MVPRRHVVHCLPLIGQVQRGEALHQRRRQQLQLQQRNRLAETRAHALAEDEHVRAHGVILEARPIVLAFIQDIVRHPLCFTLRCLVGNAATAVAGVRRARQRRR